MFSNIGGKIKGVAVAEAVIGIIASIVVGFVLIYNSSRSNPTAGLGWVIMIGGSIVSWLNSFILYGFGELIEKTSEAKAEIHNIYEMLSKHKSHPITNNENDLHLFQEQRPAFSTPIPETKHSSSRSGWKCKECGHSNETFRQMCQICGSPRNY